MRAFLHAILVCVALVVAPAAQAATFVIDFTVQNFGDLFGGVIAPTDPVSGSFTYQAASLGANIDSVTAASLTIAGHNYSLAEIGFLGNNEIGGTINGVNTIASVTNDFAVFFSQDPAAGVSFTYAAAVRGSVWEATNFSNFSITEVPSTVPLPAALPLFASGLAGLGWLARRRKRQAATA